VDPVARDAFWRLLVGCRGRDDLHLDPRRRALRPCRYAGVLLTAGRRGCAARRRWKGPVATWSGGGDADRHLPAPAAPHFRLAKPAAAGAHGAQPAAPAELSWRESLELQRDPVRATLALAGTLILMFVMGYGITMDVEDLSFAVLDRDQTAASREYIDNLSGSRYFILRAPLADSAELDRRLRSGELSLALEIPPGFARDIGRGASVQIGAWIDGSMPSRAETVAGYVQGMHQGWLAERALASTGNAAAAAPARIETRFRYNPDVQSLPAMVPAVIPLLLLMIPAMLGALAVVREKELGSILNLYVTPVTRTEFLLGKQLPYVVLAMLNFVLMVLLAVTVFGVPVTGSLATLLIGGLLYVICATGIGLLASTFTRSQVAAMFLAMIASIIPATQYSGLLDPVSSMDGVGCHRPSHPAAHFIDISRGVFKWLQFADLSGCCALAWRCR
jgi:ribosome-dependent ATPase